jgi:hypothetical protein
METGRFIAVRRLARLALSCHMGSTPATRTEIGQLATLLRSFKHTSHRSDLAARLQTSSPKRLMRTKFAVVERTDDAATPSPGTSVDVERMTGLEPATLTLARRGGPSTESLPMLLPGVPSTEFPFSPLGIGPL